MRADIEFTSCAQRIAATIWAPDRPVGVGSDSGVVFVHGRDSDRRSQLEWAEQVVAELGSTCLALDLSGHGESTGPRGDVSPDQNLLDVLAGWDRLAACRSVDRERIAICGTSYGACLGARAVRQRRVARLVLHAPTVVVDDDMAGPLRLRSESRDPASAPDLFGGLSGYRRPALVAESEHDEWIRHQVIEAYLSALPAARHEVIESARHVLSEPPWRRAFTGLLLRFLADL